MNEMEERVARAIHSRSDHASTWDELDAYSKMEYGEDARVAIEAMREPTQAMIQRGWELLRGNLRPDEIYPHMIDTALSNGVRETP